MGPPDYLSHSDKYEVCFGAPLHKKNRGYAPGEPHSYGNSRDHTRRGDISAFTSAN